MGLMVVVDLRGVGMLRMLSYWRHAIILYAKRNICGYDQALIFAKTGKKMFYNIYKELYT